MAVTTPGGGGVVWEVILNLTKSAQDNNTEPYKWALQISSTLNSAGLTHPSTELTHFLVSHICWDNNLPIAWKFLDNAFSLNLASPLLALSLLSIRVIPSRYSYPIAYRLFMELLKRHSSSFASQLHGSNYKKIMEAVDDTLHLSDTFEIHASEPSLIVVLYLFSIMWQLVDASLDDEGLLEYVPDKNTKWPTRIQDMDVDGHNHFPNKRSEHHDGTLKMNTLMAIDTIKEFLEDKVISRILFLVCQNLPSHWNGLVQRLQLLATKSSAFRNSKHLNPETFLQMLPNKFKLPRLGKSSMQQQFHAVMAPGSFVPSSSQCHGASCSSLWLPIDLFLEDSMEEITYSPTCAIDTLTGIVKSLQALNSTTWHDTFMGLWISSLRLVQREKNPCDGPVPRLDSSLCMLLSIVPLVLVNIIEEEEFSPNKETGFSQTEDRGISKSRRNELVSSLQMLGEYEGLLTPPTSIASFANQAAIKAIFYLSSVSMTSGYLDSSSINDMPFNCAGNLRHLIVEACIARNLLDISAYKWPGYVNAWINQIPHNATGQVTSWSSLMKGCSLTSLAEALASTPASSLMEIEKIYEIAVSGSNDEKIHAATVLCGASAVRGWNVQEHVVVFILRLLSPPISADYSGTDSHLISYGPFLNVLLIGISPIDIIQIFSLHGLVPQLAGALMPICEVFGSCSPTVSWTLSTGEEINSYAVFSNAFTLLLKLWSFYRTSLEQALVDVASVGSHLCPEYLLLVRNSQLSNTTSDQKKRRTFSKLLSAPPSDPIFMDSFPKLNGWYRQHQACIASTLSGLTPGTPVHQIVEALLTMLFKKINRSTTSGSSSSSSSGVEEAVLRLRLPAWDILEALPFVLDAALTACAHDKLSPRDLATGLKDLADFLPASLASIVSYLAAEVTRGVWKPASMNGTDWPSPAANLSTIEKQIHELLAATGIEVPSLPTVGDSIPTLPLPLAALLSLTITYKIDKTHERYLNLVGKSVVVLAAGCPWPCMPIVSALWAQKAKRWSDFLIFSSSRAVFNLNNDAVVQLLRSCISSVLGLNSSPMTKNGGVGALLGHGFGSHFSNGMSPVAPGIFYLRVYPFFRDLTLVTEEILSILVMSVSDISSGGFNKETSDKIKTSKFGIRYGQLSLSSAMTLVKISASVAASFVSISGGPNLIHMLIKEILPSWLISTRRSDHGEESGVVATLSGYALAHFAVLCGLLVWGTDTSSSASKCRPKVLAHHLNFMVMAIEGKVNLGCDRATWRTYVLGFLGLLVQCTPLWLQELDIHILTSLCNGLNQWNEDDLAIALLVASGIKAMGTAAELIVLSPK